MKKGFKVLSSCLMMATAILSLASCGGGKNYAANNEKYKIGVSGPLTGGAAAYGLGVANAAAMAVEEINRAGGIDGIMLELMTADDECAPEKAAVNYTSLYEKGMQFSLGCVTSGACLEYAGYAANDKVFCLTPSATNDGVPETGDNIFQMCFSDSGQGTGAATYITKNYPDAKVGVFYDSSDAYSKGIYDCFKAEYKGKTTDAAFTGDAKTNFTSQINTLKDCDFIFMPIYYSEAALFIEQAKSTFQDNVVYFGCDGLDGIDSAVKGFNVFDYKQEISYLSHFNSASTDATTVKFVADYTAKYGTETLNQFGAAAYDCVYAIAGALKGKNVPVNAAPAEFNKVLVAEFTGSYSYSGVTGKNITWAKDGTVSKEPVKYVVNAVA